MWSIYRGVDRGLFKIYLSQTLLHFIFKMEKIRFKDLSEWLKFWIALAVTLAIIS